MFHVDNSMKKNKGWENVKKRNKMRHRKRMAKIDWMRSKWFLYGGALALSIWMRTII